MAKANPDLNLDVARPEDALRVLMRAADAYRASQAELQAAWQDQRAGREWGVIAKALERAVAQIERQLR